VARVEQADISEALNEGFQQATAEKVYRLIGILREIQALQETKGQFTLKGGTALNVFHWPKAHRLSVDIDLMATGFPQATPGSPERERAVKLLEKVVGNLGYKTRREPADAGWTLRIAYLNTLGAPDQVKIDLDLLNRSTLMPPILKSGPALFHGDDMAFPVVTEEELMGQKLAAVAYRAAPRDLFDMYIMIMANWQGKPRSRSMYLAYSFLDDSEWYRLDYPVRLRVDYQPGKLEDVLRSVDHAPTLERIREVAVGGLESRKPPFTRATSEEQYLRERLLHGDKRAFATIAGETDVARARLLEQHPGLAWRLNQASRGTKSG
jgi:predicted nucleotidyltransferase component of viral defense system